MRWEFPLQELTVSFLAENITSQFASQQPSVPKSYMNHDVFHKSMQKDHDMTIAHRSHIIITSVIMILQSYPHVREHLVAFSGFSAAFSGVKLTALAFEDRASARWGGMLIP